MRGTIGTRLPNANISNATRQTLISFSTSSGAGGAGGRGRGRGGIPSSSGQFDFNARVPGKTNSDESKSDLPESPIPPGSAFGHGRGKPFPSSPVPSSLSSFISSTKPPAAGRGRITDPVMTPPATESRPPNEDSGPKKPIFFKRENGVNPTPRVEFTVSDTGDNETDHNLPSSILSVLSGHGRGKPLKQPVPESQIKEDNRHLRSRQAAAPGAPEARTLRGPNLSGDEAVKNAMNILQQRGDGGSTTGRGRGGEGRGRGRGRGELRGRGRRWRGRDRGTFERRESGGRGRQIDDSQDDYDGALYLGDNADGEKLAQRLGPEKMNQLVEAFEELSHTVLPSPMTDAYLEALDVNYAIEFEPEYLMGEFDQNPDIDEKPPIPLRDALEKMKPFLMAYEGIESHEEWEEIINDLMERVPLMKAIVDHYSGPDRVTAKKQQEELERIAKTVPESAPSSVKRFTDRAVLSLQSNPGWGFDKKYQFMDKLVREVSQHY
ncbi:Hydroxyproline-rich glycoprotein family protein, putative isoform 1 [Quillaja saponaria]|uniref:Hydroxyproline-rich glycoprotein family protein, putative isoform 1 n=1 Tax=Quillaja saponaria TaxID=32244 RepID=A0AAD7L3A6_QUISA|nr:Hydroxyproline-rich glycoprotein family protein, putative isoform 1 [Quillaja saponaria]